MNKKQLVAVAAASLAVIGCDTPDTAVTTVKSVVAEPVLVNVTTAPSPATVAGKKITFDYAGAQTSVGTCTQYPNIQWGPFTKCEPSTTTTLKFKKNNKAEQRLFADEYTIWTYKKTGANTADVSIEQHEYSETFHLTFETPTSGTATGGTMDDCNGYYKVINIRFTIK